MSTTGNPEKMLKKLIEITEAMASSSSTDDTPQHKEFLMNSLLIIVKNLTEALQTFWKSYNMGENLRTLENLPRSYTAQQPYWSSEQVKYTMNELIYRLLTLQKNVLQKRTQVLQDASHGLEHSLSNDNRLLQEQLTKLTKLKAKLQC